MIKFLDKLFSFIRLGKLFNIPIKVGHDYLFALVLITSITLFKSGVNTTINTLLYILALTVCLLMHEFGHALMARRYGASTESIALSVYGGAAAIDWHELVNFKKKGILVFLAGPAINLLLLMVFTLLAFVCKDNQFVASKVHYLQLINLMLFVFNMCPVFPLDGGGCLYLVLRILMTKERSMRILSIVGIVGSVCFLILAVWLKAIMLGVFGIIFLLSLLNIKHIEFFSYDRET